MDDESHAKNGFSRPKSAGPSVEGVSLPSGSRLQVRRFTHFSHAVALTVGPAAKSANERCWLGAPAELAASLIYLSGLHFNQ